MSRKRNKSLEGQLQFDFDALFTSSETALKKIEDFKQEDINVTGYIRTERGEVRGDQRLRDVSNASYLSASATEIHNFGKPESVLPQSGQAFSQADQGDIRQGNNGYVQRGRESENARGDNARSRNDSDGGVLQSVQASAIRSTGSIIDGGDRGVLGVSDVGDSDRAERARSAGQTQGVNSGDREKEPEISVELGREGRGHSERGDWGLGVSSRNFSGMGGALSVSAEAGVVGDGEESVTGGRTVPVHAGSMGEPIPGGGLETVRSGLFGNGLENQTAPVNFTPEPGKVYVPSGAVSRYNANVEAIRTIRLLQTENRYATFAEQEKLAAWSGWGAVPEIFDEDKEAWAERRAYLKELLTDKEYKAARATTVNAHYTDPKIVTAINKALKDIGITEGRILEPGCGSGNFIAHYTDPKYQVTGVELDPTTAAIAKYLYPAADIRSESFADTEIPQDTFDAVVGNVPFGKVKIYDALHNNELKHSLHDHFILKSLALTRPGGLVAVITSRHTMDNKLPTSRRYMHGHADLVTAVRLPSGAHKETAGTEVVSDLLIFRKRAEGETAKSWSWTESLQPEKHNNIRINSFFIDNPQNVLGEIVPSTDQFGKPTLKVINENLDNWTQDLEKILKSDIKKAGGAKIYQELTPIEKEKREETLTRTTNLFDGTIVYDKEAKTVFIAKEKVLIKTNLVETHHAELEKILEMRDIATRMLKLENSTTGYSEELEELREVLNAHYIEYTEKYGAINRYKLNRSRSYNPMRDEVTGEVLVDENGKEIPNPEDPIFVKAKYPVQKLMRQDTQCAILFAMEAFDDETQTGKPTGILVGRVVEERQTITSVENINDAIAVSLDQTGGIDSALMANLLGWTVESTEQAMLTEKQVFKDPETNKLIPEAEYLSGNVRKKLEQARLAAQDNEAFNTNITALKEVIPQDIPIEQIDARMGAAWISPEIHQEFLRNILSDNYVQVHNPLPGKWVVKGNSRSFIAKEKWGTPDFNAIRIADACIAQKPITVTKKQINQEGKEITVIDGVKTVAATEKAEAMQNRFASWIWEDPKRASLLHKKYNQMFNSIVLRDYTKAGEHLTLPGLSLKYKLRPHQKAAVARMIAEGSVGLFHGVGAGKTLEMVVGATELKRLGLVKKPMIVVPNHMIEQVSREWLLAYPNARVLAANSNDISDRRSFVARAATNDWDGVIMSHGAFSKLQVSEHIMREYIEEKVELYRGMLLSGEDMGLTVKQMESLVKNEEGRLNKALQSNPRMPGISFNDMGVDYLIVDEAHEFKNLKFPTNIQGLSIKGSSKATDLDMKLQYLRSKHGTRAVALATATPLSNSVSEAWTMQHFLRPDLLEERGLDSFDSWAATFGEITTDIEISVTGNFKQKSRFSKFRNVPEMLRLWQTFADVKTHEELDLPLPAIAKRESDGARLAENIVIEPTSQLVEYMKELGDRTDKVSQGIDPHIDNMLSITNDGKKSALDLRLLDDFDDVYGQVKVDKAAQTIFDEWDRTKNNEYVQPETGDLSTTPGGLQLVFCDLGTPKPDKWNVYDELKNQLVFKGIPAEKIRFIHEAKNDVQKAEIFQDARQGKIAVLIGSTGKMGVGTNVQDRITAMHHIDCPWRPADIEQRDGRGIRQGNQNPEVKVFRYITGKSFDAYMWQTIERKAKFIAQVMRGKIDVREMEDPGDLALSAAETKAITTDNPLLLEKAEADAHLQKLKRAQTAHYRQQESAKFTVESTTQQINVLTRNLENLEAAKARTQDINGDNFKMIIDNKLVTKRVEAKEAIAQYMEDNGYMLSRATPNETWKVGEIAGHEVIVKKALGYVPNTNPTFQLSLKNVPGKPVDFRIHELIKTEGYGHITRLENQTRPEFLEKQVKETQVRLEEAKETLEEATNQVGKPFAKQTELEKAETKVLEIQQKMRTKKENDLPKQNPNNAYTSNITPFDNNGLTKHTDYLR